MDMVLITFKIGPTQRPLALDDLFFSVYAVLTLLTAFLVGLTKDYLSSFSLGGLLGTTD